MTTKSIEYTSALFKCVVPWDPAINLELTDIDLYAKTRDFDLLRFHEGSQPTIYHLRQIPLTSRLAMDGYRPTNAGVNYGGTVTAFFMHAVVKVDNLRHEDGTISNFEALHPMALGGGKTMRVISQSAFDEHFGHLTKSVIDIGTVAYERSFLELGTTPDYPVPHTSQRLLDARKATLR